MRHHFITLGIVFFSFYLQAQERIIDHSQVIWYEGMLPKHPEIQIIQPDTATFNHSGGVFLTTEELVSIEGRIKDPTRIDKLTINGKQIDYQSNGVFNYEQRIDIGKLASFEISANNRTDERSHKVLFFKRFRPEKRVALVIGNGTYDHENSLRNPTNDAEVMAETLSGLNFEVFHHQNLGLKDLKIELEKFTFQAEEADVVWIYFSGHGFQLNNTNYIVPVDGQFNMTENGPENAINVGDLVSTIEKNKNDYVFILVLDACRNTPTITRSLKGQVTHKGLTTMDPPEGTIVAYATAPGRTADDGTGKYGLYTEALIEQMKKPQPIEDVFKNTLEIVDKKSKGKQQPRFDNGLKGSFSLH